MNSVQPINPGGSDDIIQTVFQLSLLSGLGQPTKKDPRGLTGSAAYIERKMKELLNACLQSQDYIEQIGVWELAWGPSVFQYKGVILDIIPFQSNVADNAMYVAYNAQADCYVVAIAGTSFSSLYDQKLDLGVRTVVDFPCGIVSESSTNPSNRNVGSVAEGAALGTTNLLNMKDPDTGKTLQSFLNENASSTRTLVFTGHSLGGSLSPTLAYWLYPNTDSMAKWKGVYVLPTAGPGTGDQGFVDGYGRTFAPLSISGIPAKYAFWNQLIWNEYDIVPHAWTNLMNVLPPGAPNDVLWRNGEGAYQTIYGKLHPLDTLAVHSLVQLAYDLAKPNTYVRLPSQMFSLGQPQVTNFEEFLITMGEQHLFPYCSFFGIPVPDPDSLPRPRVTILTPGAVEHL